MFKEVKIVVNSEKYLKTPSGILQNKLNILKYYYLKVHKIIVKRKS